VYRRSNPLPRAFARHEGVCRSGIVNASNCRHTAASRAARVPQTPRSAALPAVHWRSDAEEALLLGERVAISVLRDQRHCFNEPFVGFTFTKFDGRKITV
jgi:hypothetical protein